MIQQRSVTNGFGMIKSLSLFAVMAIGLGLSVTACGARADDQEEEAPGVAEQAISCGPHYHQSCWNQGGVNLCECCPSTPIFEHLQCDLNGNCECCGGTHCM